MIIIAATDIARIMPGIKNIYPKILRATANFLCALFLSKTVPMIIGSTPKNRVIRIPAAKIINRLIKAISTLPKSLP